MKRMEIPVEKDVSIVAYYMVLKGSWLTTCFILSTAISIRVQSRHALKQSANLAPAVRKKQGLGFRNMKPYNRSF